MRANMVKIIFLCLINTTAIKKRLPKGVSIMLTCPDASANEKGVQKVGSAIISINIVHRDVLTDGAHPTSSRIVSVLRFPIGRNAPKKNN